MAKNGVGFEERIRDKEMHNAKFCFLNPNDPYHKYYLLQIKNWQSGVANAQPPPPAAPPATLSVKPGQSGDPGANGDHPAPSNNSVPMILPPPPPGMQEPKTIPLPPPPNDFLGETPSLSKQDVDIIKLTAQFVARNGTKFMTSLSQREHKNYQFDFLRPSHNLYPYFTKLVEQYTRILVPPRDLFGGLETQASNRYKVLDEIMKKVEYEAYVMHQKEKARIAADEEKIAFATIDWHDFVVVETIEFFESDNRAVLPPPMSIMELQSMTLEQRKGLISFDGGAGAARGDGDDGDGDDDDMEMDMDDDDNMDMDQDEGWCFLCVCDCRLCQINKNIEHYNIIRPCACCPRSYCYHFRQGTHHLAWCLIYYPKWRQNNLCSQRYC